VKNKRPSVSSIRNIRQTSTSLRQLCEFKKDQELRCCSRMKRSYLTKLECCPGEFLRLTRAISFCASRGDALFAKKTPLTTSFYGLVMAKRINIALPCLSLSGRCVTAIFRLCTRTRGVSRLTTVSAKNIDRFPLLIDKLMIRVS